MVSHVGAGAGPTVRAKCDSPRTSVGVGRDSGAGYGGSARRRKRGGRPSATIANTDRTSDAAKNVVENQSVA